MSTARGSVGITPCIRIAGVGPEMRGMDQGVRGLELGGDVRGGDWTKLGVDDRGFLFGIWEEECFGVQFAGMAGRSWRAGVISLSFCVGR